MMELKGRNVESEIDEIKKDVAECRRKIDKLIDSMSEFIELNKKLSALLKY